MDPPLEVRLREMLFCRLLSFDDPDLEELAKEYRHN